MAVVEVGYWRLLPADIRNLSVSCRDWELLPTELVRSHGEHFDGSGYPRGLKGAETPIGARLFAVIDTLDAITSDRSYRRGLEFDQAEEEILRLFRSKFDPVAVPLFIDRSAAHPSRHERLCPW